MPRKQSVLIVEENPIVSYDLENRVSKMGFEIYDTCIDLNDAVRSMSPNKAYPSVAVIDIKMHDFLSRFCLAYFFFLLLKIPILITTSSFQRDVLYFKNAHNHLEYLHKPFTRRQFDSAIKRLTEKGLKGKSGVTI